MEILPLDKILREEYHVDEEWYERWFSKQRVHNCFLDEVSMSDLRIQRLDTDCYVIDRLENHPAVSFFKGDRGLYIEYMKMNDEYNPEHEHSIERMELLEKICKPKAMIQSC